MSYRLDRNWNRVRRNVEDIVDDAGDAYEDFTGEVKERASRAWDKRDEYVEDVVSLAETAADAVYARFRADPLGTLAVGAIALWLAGRLLRR
jgi:ElaB/YqjD/DUF883 family membrane-anchored ribosome-binding protein